MIWYVALGSATGGVARFLLGGAVQRVSGSTFPIWTLVINVTGSLALGFLMRYLVEGAPVTAEVRALLTVGFCGGYTTFSTFSYETATLLEQGDWRRGSLYIIGSVTLSLLATGAGMALARTVLVAARDRVGTL
jgi:CrcB protein